MIYELRFVGEDMNFLWNDKIFGSFYMVSEYFTNFVFYMSATLPHFIRRLSRIPRSRGFGVQSPWAYRFVRSVACERRPYYAYEDHSQHLLSLSKAERRVCRFMVRLANFVQAEEWIVFGKSTEPYRRYIQSGSACSDVTLFSQQKITLRPDQSWAVLLNEADNQAVEYIKGLFQNNQNASAVVVADISYNHRNQLMWRKLQQELSPSVTFDLLDCGVMFFQPASHRQVYRIKLPST